MYTGTVYNENVEQYHVDYSLNISGIPSRAGAEAWVTLYGEIHAFFHNPDVFEGINIDVTIHEQDYLDRVERDLQEKYGDTLTGYEIDQKRLNVKDGKIVFEFFVAVNAGETSYGETLVYEVS